VSSLHDPRARNQTPGDAWLKTPGAAAASMCGKRRDLRAEGLRQATA